MVQSTRAGAMFGLGLLGGIVLANVMKYPAFRFGPQYAAATGRSLIEGYLGLGRWVLALYLASEILDPEEEPKDLDEFDNEGITGVVDFNDE